MDGLIFRIFQCDYVSGTFTAVHPLGWSAVTPDTRFTGSEFYLLGVSAAWVTHFTGKTPGDDRGASWLQCEQATGR